ncbi:AraC family transcriptional regulator [Paraburkholderia sp. ZP32-5]|uniref:AraC family transcriptional regulator n=1 Tax=Paraburkholderia sp. ZP32-5 TaxID=2883245 RepID=UPI001F4211DD|nr:AraC family transcriptional regulator [Paraburkholderia sp. ZP32-5]
MRSEIIDDPLSGILRLIGAQPIVAGGFSAGGRWAVRFPRPEKIKFFAVVKGDCWLIIETAPAPIRVEQGDILLTTGQHAFVLASDPDVAPVDAIGLFQGTTRKTALLGNGQDCEQIGGHIQLAPPNGALLVDVLPPLIHIRASTEHAVTLQWLLARLVGELTTHLPGSGIAANNITLLMFVEILRIHLATADAITSNWLRAIGDARLAPALRLMHEDLGKTWRLDELAAACAMSRTAFAVRFKEVAGMAPMAWLTQWRMRIAMRMLVEQDTPMAALAEQLGYASESAFSTAFKRVAGSAPRAYRAYRHSERMV